MRNDVTAAHERVRRVEQALEAVDGMPPAQRERAMEAIQALLELYGAAFERVLARLDRDDPTIRLAAVEHIAGSYRHATVPYMERM